MSPVERWIIVRMVEEQGQTRQQTAQAVRCSTRTVSRIIRLHRDTGDVVEQHAGGRKHAYNPKQMRRLDTLIQQNKHATASGLRVLMGPRAPPITDRTMRKYRRELTFTRRREGIELFDSPEYEKRRIDWAKQHRNDPILQWCFSDASTLILRHTGDLVWVKRGKPTPPHTITALTPGVNLWGVVWNDGCCFAQYKGHLNEDKLFDLLLDAFAPQTPYLANRTLVLDGVSYQWTDDIQTFFHDSGIVPLKLPPHSPRFNAIERCWQWIKHHVKAASPGTPAALQQAVANACQALPIDVIRAHIRDTKEHILEYAEK